MWCIVHNQICPRFGFCYKISGAGVRGVKLTVLKMVINDFSRLSKF